MRRAGFVAQHRKGVLLMVGATLCWASAGMLVRNMDLRDSWEITFWRSLFMTLFIVVVLIAQYRGKVLTRLAATGKAGIVAGALWALMYVCFILALGHTTVANVLVLSSISPFTAALLGRLFLHERIPGRTWLTMLAAFGGIVLMFIESVDSGGLIGNLIALAIPFAFAVNVIILRRMHARVDMIPTLVLSGLFSMAVALPFAWPLAPTGKDLGLLAVMGVFQLGMGVVLMILAAPHLAAAEIGLLAVLETIFGTLSTWWVVGERPGVIALLGGGVVIVALVVNELFGLRRPALTEEEEAVREVSGAGH
ncbi:MAG TPA: DMT family transporter [Burkholderiales bacterium]|nr:DMT family transporter [Burkholderiales bacterium]